MSLADVYRSIEKKLGIKRDKSKKYVSIKTMNIYKNFVKDNNGKNMIHTFGIWALICPDASEENAIFFAELVEKELKYLVTKDGKFDYLGKLLTMSQLDEIYERYNS